MSSQFNPVVGIERSIPRGAAHQAVGLLQVPFRCAVVLVRVEVEFALRCFCRWCDIRSEEHTSELQSLMRISYAVFCLKKKNTTISTNNHNYIYHIEITPIINLLAHNKIR